MRYDRLAFAFVICTAAILLPFWVFETRVEPFHCVYDVCRLDPSAHVLVSLGVVNVPTKPTRVGRAWIEGEKGIFLVRGLPLLAGIALGIVVPLLLLAWATYLTLWSGRPST